MLLPVWAELFHFIGEPLGGLETSLKNTFPLLGLAVGLIFVSLEMGGNQSFSLLALPFLAFSNGQRGTRSLKWFFYIFYPSHLLAIGAVATFAIR